LGRGFFRILAPILLMLGRKLVLRGQIRASFFGGGKYFDLTCSNNKIKMSAIFGGKLDKKNPLV
jgi:hypothetical protein